jgi:hypothetical protein
MSPIRHYESANPSVARPDFKSDFLLILIHVSCLLFAYEQIIAMAITAAIAEHAPRTKKPTSAKQ